MDLVDKIEKRRFFGRELLLWIWFESEIFDATLTASPFGSFGCYIERMLLLSAGKETTHIKGALPARAREAKEALRRGKLPERAGLRLILGERESSFTLKADTLGISGLALPDRSDERTRSGRGRRGEIGSPAEASQYERRRGRRTRGGWPRGVLLRKDASCTRSRVARGGALS